MEREVGIKIKKNIHSERAKLVANTKQINENMAMEKQFLVIGFWGLIII